MKYLPACLFLFIVFATGLLRGQEIRQPVYAGQFYPGGAAELSDLIDSYLEAAGDASSSTGPVKAIIVPHAGYMYSGKVAAFAYRQVRGANISSVVIVGTSHRHGFHGCSIFTGSGYKTPLGTAAVDVETARALAEATGYSFIPEAHASEHSVEVQVPFIQTVLPGAKIVPVVMGYPEKRTIRTLAEGLKKVLADTQALVVASTDLSHFYAKDRANAVDRETLELIRQGRTEALIRKLERGENIMCGGGPVVAAVLYGQTWAPIRVEILKYADSSDAGGPESEVVGYLAAAIATGPSREAPVFSLTEDERSLLKRLARSSVETYLREGTFLDPPPPMPSLEAKTGAFVTLEKSGRLRGCIGFVEPVLPLYQTVIRAAVYAAVRDTRFPPVRQDELDDLDFEISVLSPLRKIEDTNLIEVGRHGLLISSRDGRSGLLLPQVAVDNRWSRQTFLEQTCRKAGLPRDAWKGEVEICVFEAVVF